MEAEIGTTRKDFHVITKDLTFVLGVSAIELSELHRSSVLDRTEDNRHRALWPVFDCIRRYCAYVRCKRQAVHQDFLKAKAGRERAQQERVERENRVAAA